MCSGGTNGRFQSPPDDQSIRWANCATPRNGCDAWKLHHRAYFAAPTVWPGVLIWSLAAFKPDQSIATDWADRQDAQIETADRSAAQFIDDQDAVIAAVHDRMGN
ncbi:hypothetical protein [Gordonia humi]|uniref:hypothetical protein n=1 Tax=Gordonia humi TaxID=686429 RepID=UPI0031E8BD5C